MKFYIDNLLLWLKNGNLVNLEFKNDKINIITGNSKTGKTAILEIIDYCMCGSKDTVTISHEHIGENVSWYGIRFHINDKVFTIARGEITDREFSKDYYFSQSGEIPDLPSVKMGESEIKKILEMEFSVDNEITLSYGGKGVRKDARLSFRFFLMFSTLSKDIVDNGKTYFDKLHLERYRDVWPQVFDLALGVIDFEIVKAQKALLDLQQDLYTLEQRKKKAEKNAAARADNIELLVKKAKEARLINEDLPVDAAFKEIESIIQNSTLKEVSDYSVQQEYEKLLTERENVQLQLAKLTRFKRSYNEYRKNLRAEEDALKPIIYIQKQFTDRTSGEYRQFLNRLSIELEKIKKAINEIHPFETDVNREIQKLRNQLKQLDSKLDKTAHVDYRTIPAVNKLITLGELKAEYSYLEKTDDSVLILEQDIAEKRQKIEEADSTLASVSETRSLSIDTLNEYIQTYITLAHDALDEYGDYCARFDYKKAVLTLRKSKTAAIANISSSSDHLFMHLCLFAGLHHMLLSQNSRYIPSFLIIDQPSRPYFNSAGDYNYEESEKAITIKDDWTKVKNIFTLWDQFFSIILSQGKHFQIIMLEHVSENAWSGCKNIHLVDIFDGIHKALIPVDYSNSSTSST